MDTINALNDLLLHIYSQWIVLSLLTKFKVFYQYFWIRAVGKKITFKKKKQQEKKGICIKVMIQLLTQWGIRTILTLSHRATRMAL